MYKPLASIVTPAYNAEKFIEDTLRSVMYQDYPHIEHIVIDDGSKDSTVNILKKYEHKYNLRWFSKRNEGQTITVNRGFELANGDIVVWLNADDVLLNRQVIANVVKEFGRDSEINVVYGHMAIIDENNRIIKVQYSIPWFTYDKLLRTHFAACIFYRKKIAQKYELDPALNYVMDYEQSLRMCRDGVKFGYLNRVLIGYRRHKATKSTSKKTEAKAEVREIRKKYGQKFGISYCFLKYLDNITLLTFKLCGIKTVVDLYRQPQKFQLAFDAKFDSLMKLVARQTLPYVN